MGCDNCKYLDDCPFEFQSEAGGYCENWEPAQPLDEGEA